MTLLLIRWKSAAADVNQEMNSNRKKKEMKWWRSFGAELADVPLPFSAANEAFLSVEIRRIIKKLDLVVFSDFEPRELRTTLKFVSLLFFIRPSEFWQTVKVYYYYHVCVLLFDPARFVLKLHFRTRLIICPQRSCSALMSAKCLMKLSFFIRRSVFPSLCNVKPRLIFLVFFNLSEEALITVWQGVDGLTFLKHFSTPRRRNHAEEIN